MDISQYHIDWQAVMTFLNSAFTTSLVGAMFGALAGAIAAQRIANRSKEREHFSAQLRITNSAIMSAFVIANAALSIKKQYIKNLFDNYKAQKAAHDEHKQKIDAGELPTGTPFDLALDLREINMQKVPIEALEAQVFERLSIDGRPLALTAAIAGSLANLDEALSKRNALISEFKSYRGTDKEKIPLMYLGAHLPDGNLSTEYADSLEGAYKYTDDIIYFSKLLAEDLEKHGETIKLSHEKKHGKVSQKVSTADFSIAKEQDLLPNDADFSDWLKGFSKHEAPDSKAS